MTIYAYCPDCGYQYPEDNSRVYWTNGEILACFDDWGCCCGTGKMLLAIDLFTRPMSFTLWCPGCTHEFGPFSLIVLGVFISEVDQPCPKCDEPHLLVSFEL